MASPSKAPLTPEESKLKSLVIVVVTIAALIALVVRPFVVPDEKQVENSNEKSAEKVAEADKRKTDSSIAPGTSAKDGKQTKSDKEERDSAKKTLSPNNSGSSNNNKKNNQSKQKLPAEKQKPKSVNSNQANPSRGPPTDRLEKIGTDLYRSKAGLIYGLGSKDKHRLTHVLRHREDDPTKPIHGVFDGTPDEVLELIDEGYERIKKKHSSVTESRSGKRTVYTVYFGRRIGFIGGQTGKRKKHPLTKSLVLVLEGERVITAYPK